MSTASLSRAIAILLAGIIGIPSVLLTAGWLWLLFSPTPLAVPIASWAPWPMACTSHGCITTQDWLRQQQLNTAFAQTTKTEAPSDKAILTTLIRHHLVEVAVLSSPVKPSDAKRYREDILNLKTTDQLQRAIPVSLETYDTYVIIPFLQQEALKQERKIATTNELYIQLAGERKVFLLPLTLHWDTDKGMVVSR